MLVADVSLLQGFFPETLSVLTLLSLATASVRMGWRWWVQRVLPIIAISLLAAIVTNWALDLQSQFDEVIPFKFLVWAAMPLTAIGLVIAGWRYHPRWQRAVAVAAVPLALLYAANLVNQFYGYEPTLGDLFGTDLNHQVDAGQLGLQPMPPAGAPTELGSRTTDVNAHGSAANGNADPNVPGRIPDTVAAVTTTLTPAVQSPTTNVSGQVVLHGTVSAIAIPGTESKFNARTAFVWVPPAFFHTPRPALPVVVMLAGVPGQPDNMIRAAGADKTANAYASAHGGVAPILIFADGNGSFAGDTECVDGVHGNAETYLTKDVPAFVTQAFGTLTGPAHWGIEGYSEGGTCAMDLALAHPDVYGTFVDIAGDQFPNLGTQGDAKATAIANLYGGNPALFDAHDPMLLINRPLDKSIAGWFEVGTKDHRKGDVASVLDAAMRQAGLQSQFRQAPGGHDFPMATIAVSDSFSWLASRVGA